MVDVLVEQVGAVCPKSPYFRQRHLLRIGADGDLTFKRRIEWYLDINPSEPAPNSS